MFAHSLAKTSLGVSPFLLLTTLHLLPVHCAAIKRQVYEAAERDLRPSFDRASKLMTASFTNSDFKEGVSSYVQKRTPAFNGVGVRLHTP